MKRVRLSNEKEVVKVTAEGLVNEFMGFKGCGFARLTTNTQPKLVKVGRVSGHSVQTKIGCSPEDVIKVSEFVCGLGYDYATSVQNKLVAEGKDPASYEPKPSWHVPVNGSRVIRQHKDKGDNYFYCQLNSNTEPKSEFYDVRNDRIIPKEVIEEFLPPSYPDKGTGVDVRLFKVENIVEVSACGKIYEVID